MFQSGRRQARLRFRAWVRLGPPKPTAKPGTQACYCQGQALLLHLGSCCSSKHSLGARMGPAHDCFVHSPGGLLGPRGEPEHARV
eukprot:13255791-Alexandrium_andersonii.AAC.1